MDRGCRPAPMTVHCVLIWTFRVTGLIPVAARNTSTRSSPGWISTVSRTFDLSLAASVCSEVTMSRNARDLIQLRRDDPMSAVATSVFYAVHKNNADQIVRPPIVWPTSRKAPQPR